LDDIVSVEILDEFFGVFDDLLCNSNLRGEGRDEKGVLFAFEMHVGGFSA